MLSFLTKYDLESGKFFDNFIAVTLLVIFTERIISGQALLSVDHLNVSASKPSPMQMNFLQNQFNIGLLKNKIWPAIKLVKKTTIKCRVRLCNDSVVEFNLWFAFLFYCFFSIFFIRICFPLRNAEI